MNFQVVLDVQFSRCVILYLNIVLATEILCQFYGYIISLNDE